jgi:uncharacterized membrane protein
MTLSLALGLPPAPSLETLHAATVHIPIGGAFIALVLYAIAARARSERWFFAADVTTVIVAITLVLAVATGLVANARVHWPGGIEPWRLAHIVSGVAATLIVVVFAALRMRARARSATRAPFLVFVAAGACFSSVAIVGWIGGDGLVYDAGIGVSAAGHGALAPSTRSEREPPKSLLDSMRRARGAWASVYDAIAAMMVGHPDVHWLGVAARDADRLQREFRWMATNESHSPSPSQDLQRCYAAIADASGSLARSLDEHRIVAATAQLGAITTACVGCHAEYRWPGELSPGVLSTEIAWPGVEGALEVRDACHAAPGGAR